MKHPCGLCSSTGVFGTLDLYGKPHDVYHTKLASTASAGTDTLTLREAVDWQVRVSLRGFVLRL